MYLTYDGYKKARDLRPDHWIPIGAEWCRIINVGITPEGTVIVRLEDESEVTYPGDAEIDVAIEVLS